jgi:Histidine kinase-, DNA gyrase B-, and HSP90-like ATPase
VSDNGRGLTPRGLDEAMRYGSSPRYGQGALGGFGLGLKTASLSQCRRLFIASRRTSKARPEVRLWDLDEVRSLDDWMLERLLPSESPPELLEPLRESAGTVVLWEALDRVMLYRNPLGLRAEGAMRALGFEVARHLSMVFHRFLAGEARRPIPLTILVNGEKLDPWDPFVRSEADTVALPVQSLEVRRGRSDHVVTVRPYLLPSQQRFSSVEAHHAAAGPKR